MFFVGKVKKIIKSCVIAFFIAFFFGKRDNLGRSDDAKRRKKGDGQVSYLTHAIEIQLNVYSPGKYNLYTLPAVALICNFCDLILKRLAHTQSFFFRSSVRRNVVLYLSVLFTSTAH